MLAVVALLPFTLPFDFASLLRFLKARAIPGLESVDDSCYRREDVTVSLAPSQKALAVNSPSEDVHRRVRHLFDLDADPAAIASHLGKHACLRLRPGVRVAGCWDPFELAVRAIVGQQISVKGASTLMGRIHSSFGLTPEALAAADLTAIGLTKSRAETLRSLAALVARDGLQLEGLARIRGIGPWTLQYISMRALKNSDAFPAEDLILRRAASTNGAPLTPKQLIARAEAWRPYRAYAVIALWQAYSEKSAN